MHATNHLVFIQDAEGGKGNIQDYNSQSPAGPLRETKEEGV